jgi:lipopolysaccharide transport system ATP-binding protein
MSLIEFQKVCIDFPIFNGKSRSLKHQLINLATGGQLNSANPGCVVVRALDDVSFVLKDGDRVGVIGHNGSGKSTLLRCLGGVYKPTYGNANIVGKCGSLIDISLGIDPEATGRENIYIRAALLEMTRGEIESRFTEIEHFADLGNFIDLPVRTYSSGMHLRLAFSVSTVMRPNILLMDEWLSVGDEDFRVKAEGRVTEMVSSTNILVIATHSRELVHKICNRVLYFEHGRLVADGSPEEVCKQYFK